MYRRLDVAAVGACCLAAGALLGWTLRSRRRPQLELPTKQLQDQQQEARQARVARFDGKPRVCVGCSGSVAAVKLGELVRRLVEDHHLFVDVVLTRAGAFFQGVEYKGRRGWDELRRLQALKAEDGTPWVEVWQDDDEWRGYRSVERSRVLHVDLAKRNGLLVVAPACANTLAAYHAARADNLLTSLLLAWHDGLADGPFTRRLVGTHGAASSTVPVLFCPAMNTFMHEDARVQAGLRALGPERVVPAQEKELACKDVGPGAMADVDVIVARAVAALQAHQEQQQQARAQGKPALYEVER